MTKISPSAEVRLTYVTIQLPNAPTAFGASTAALRTGNHAHLGAWQPSVLNGCEFNRKKDMSAGIKYDRRRFLNAAVMRTSSIAVAAIAGASSAIGAIMAIDWQVWIIIRHPLRDK